MRCLRAFRYELVKNLRKKRTFWGFLAVTALVSIMLTAYLLSGWNPVERYARRLTPMQTVLLRQAMDTDSYANGTLFATLYMGLLSYALMPVLAVAFGGELISSEIQSGTLRTALVRPVTRFGFYMTKYAYALLITLGFVLFTAVLTYLLGIIFLGRGPLLVQAAFWGPELRHAFPMLHRLSEGTALMRYFVAYLCVAVAIMTMTTLSFTLSTLVKHTGAAMIVAISTYFILHILALTPWLESWRPYLFVTKMNYWLPVFAPDPDSGKIWTDAGYFALYNVGLLLPGLIVFLRRDVQC
ncbi:MAG: ABC transporter permease subunit [Verrucomicrobia bacterium]|nr:ABC transporter permease subunit [Verrucomicrobiota bacterium]